MVARQVVKQEGTVTFPGVKTNVAAKVKVTQKDGRAITFSSEDGCETGGETGRDGDISGGEDKRGGQVTKANTLSYLQIRQL
ncbi:hypothetical protein SLEP1_g29259 [Rubroshorea leprosula]|uniref:Uncharacterized protein n=1 Tax=Rubroshorea leprosula TaxID=152421 RepID=A0AAV5K3E0_9ROSI|nr:hypothetical protein SLEP1_g29259 [Rubroshorea leprosula]